MKYIFAALVLASLAGLASTASSQSCQTNCITGANGYTSCFTTCS